MRLDLEAPDHTTLSRPCARRHCGDSAGHNGLRVSSWTTIGCPRSNDLTGEGSRPSPLEEGLGISSAGARRERRLSVQNRPAHRQLTTSSFQRASEPHELGQREVPKEDESGN
jgi:hypothetical protein